MKIWDENTIQKDVEPKPRAIVSSGCDLRSVWLYL